MGDIWNFLIVKPFSWLLSFFNSFTGNYGLAIILFAVVVKVILLYFSARGKRSMMQTQRLQPKLKELEKKYQNDRAQYQMAVQQLYKSEGVSMMGGCLWSLLPFPILLALYGVIRSPFETIMGFTPPGTDPVPLETIHNAVANAGADLSTITDATTKAPLFSSPYYQLDLSNALHEPFAQVRDTVGAEIGSKLVDINYNFLGLNLAATPTLDFNWLIIIPILSGLTAFLSMRLSTKMTAKITGNVQQPGQGKMMMLMMPALSVYFGFIMPALMGVYWIANNVLGAVQDYFLTKHYMKKFAEEDERRAELDARRKAAEAAMKQEQRERRAAKIEEQKKKRKPGTTVYKMTNKPAPKKKDSEDDLEDEE